MKADKYEGSHLVHRLIVSGKNSSKFDPNLNPEDSPVALYFVDPQHLNG